ncbi:hypothetical protein B0H14DRAFT_2635355 [Mycena olivaceomarginata]|nr:hypothetical protein B0H14DRAFT_2635355 [Mycena olivaceomarginata]
MQKQNIDLEAKSKEHKIASVPRSFRPGLPHGRRVSPLQVAPEVLTFEMTVSQPSSATGGLSKPLSMPMWTPDHDNGCPNCVVGTSAQDFARGVWSNWQVDVSHLNDEAVEFVAGRAKRMKASSSTQISRAVGLFDCVVWTRFESFYRPVQATQDFDRIVVGDVRSSELTEHSPEPLPRARHRRSRTVQAVRPPTTKQKLLAGMIAFSRDYPLTRNTTGFHRAPLRAPRLRPVEATLPMSLNEVIFRDHLIGITEEYCLQPGLTILIQYMRYRNAALDPMMLRKPRARKRHGGMGSGRGASGVGESSESYFAGKVVFSCKLSTIFRRFGGRWRGGMITSAKRRVLEHGGGQGLFFETFRAPLRLRAEKFVAGTGAPPRGYCNGQCRESSRTTRNAADAVSWNHTEIRDSTRITWRSTGVAAGQRWGDDDKNCAESTFSTAHGEIINKVFAKDAVPGEAASEYHRRVTDRGVRAHGRER